MGETHGHENQTRFRILAELTPIEKIRVRQNGLKVLEIAMSGDTHDGEGGLTKIIFLPHRKHSHIVN
jgi:hypothetical protein